MVITISRNPNTATASTPARYGNFTDARQRDGLRPRSSKHCGPGRCDLEGYLRHRGRLDEIAVGLLGYRLARSGPTHYQRSSDGGGERRESLMYPGAGLQACIAVHVQRTPDGGTGGGTTGPLNEEGRQKAAAPPDHHLVVRRVN